MKSIDVNSEGFIPYVLLNSSFISNMGLFSGKMGLVLFFAHHGRQTENELYEEFAAELLDEIYEELSVASDIDLRNGLCGIGWGVEYLIRRGFVDGDTDEVLEDIDSKIMERDPRRITDLSFETGLGGIIFYALARLTSPRNSNTLTLDTQYIVDLRSAVQKADFKDSDNIPKGLTEAFLQASQGELTELYTLTLPSQMLENKDNKTELPIGSSEGLIALCFSKIKDL